MSMTDPISDMLTRIRNAQLVFKKTVDIPHSKKKEDILKVLFDEGYIASCKKVVNDAKQVNLLVELKYFKGKAVIESIKRISKPSLRVYSSVNKLPKALEGLGVVIVSTSKGVVTDRKARELCVGGEIICIVV